MSTKVHNATASPGTTTTLFDLFTTVIVPGAEYVVAKRWSEADYRKALKRAKKEVHMPKKKRKGY